jgi:hypothetical protein
MKTIGVAAVIALATACSGGDDSADDQACTAVEDAIDAMETNATAVDDAIQELIASASAADDQTLRAAADDLDAAVSDPSRADTFGAVLSDLTDRCEDL